MLLEKVAGLMYYIFFGSLLLSNADTDLFPFLCSKENFSGILVFVAKKAL